jgi:hypothetical protein
VHGIDLGKLSPAERKVLELVLDPKQKNVQSKIPLVNNIRKRMDPTTAIHDPLSFYARFVKPFLNGKDAYRMYAPRLMSAVTIMHDFSIATGKRINQNPLFGPKPTQATTPVASPTKGMSPIDIMAHNAKNRIK